jgi:hypothetical protein
MTDAKAELAGSRTTPFVGMRWLDERPAVLIDSDWAELVAIEGVPLADIVSFAKAQYPRPPTLWRKRISEDLAEVMTAMGHPLESQVRLEIRRSGGAPELLEAAMTADNRARVLQENRRAAMAEGPGASPLGGFARVAPYTGARFHGEQIDVQVQLQDQYGWYNLLGMDGVPTARLVAVAQERFGASWQRRIAEDPAEVLAASKGSPPGPTVELQLEEPGSQKPLPPLAAPMTEANRRAVHHNWSVEPDPTEPPGQ